MNHVAISVVIPVRNCESTLGAAIQSVLNQSVEVQEIIVVDDGSTDGSKGIAQSFLQKVSVLDGPQLGAGPARNLGVCMATGRWIAFLDADDLWLPKKLEHQIPYLDEDSIVGTYANYVTGANRKYLGTSIRTKNDEVATERLAAGESLGCLLSSWVMSRDQFLSLGGFDPNYVVAQDFEFAVRAMRSGMKLKVVRSAEIEYMIHAESETAQTYLSQFMTAMYVRLYLQKRTISTLSEFLNGDGQSRRLRRLAWAGLHFRTFLVRLGESRFVSAAGHLAASSVLSPSTLLKKLVQQGPRLWSRH